MLFQPVQRPHLTLKWGRETVKETDAEQCSGLGPASGRGGSGARVSTSSLSDATAELALAGLAQLRQLDSFTAPLES